MADKELVYTPISKVEPEQVQTPKQIDKPDYDDVGVSFKGYSKSLYSGNDFRLNPQRSYYLLGHSDGTFNLAAGDFVDITINALGTVKIESPIADFTKEKAYITSMCLRVVATTTNTRLILRVYDGVVAAATIPFILNYPTDNLQEVIFTPPLKFTKGIHVVIKNESAVPCVVDAASVNFYGWLE